MTAHFYDDTTHLSREITSQWAYGTGFDDGPIPCIDWCDNGAIPEYPGWSWSVIINSDSFFEDPVN